MKIITLIALCTVLLTQGAQDHKIVKVEFTSLTRGYHESVVFTPDSIVANKPDVQDRQKTLTTSKTMAAKNWKHLTGLVQSVPRPEFENLQSPTNKRTYDGAQHSTITITLENNETYSHGFDDEQPHEKLVPLMKCISRLKVK